MIARKQNVGDLAAFPHPWACVLRVFQQAVAKALLNNGGLVAKNARQEADACLYEHQRRGFASRQDDVGHRYFLHPPRLYDALVYALEASAKHHQTRARCPIRDMSLRNWRAAGREADDGSTAATNAIKRGSHNIGSENHARAAASRRIIDVLVGADTELAKVDGVERPLAVAQTSSQERKAEGSRKRFWKEGESGGCEHHGLV